MVLEEARHLHDPLTPGRRGCGLRLLRFAIPLALLATSGGCAVVHVDRLILSAEHPRREFVDPGDGGEYLVSGGAFTGAVGRVGARWLRFEFPGLLESDAPRLLEVLLLVGGSRGRIGEAATSEQAPAPARIVIG